MEVKVEGDRIGEGSGRARLRGGLRGRGEVEVKGGGEGGVKGASKGGLVRVGRDRGGPPGQTKAKNRAEGVKNGIQMGRGNVAAVQHQLRAK